MSYLFQIFGRHSLDVSALVQDNFRFLVCLSVCSLPHFLTDIMLTVDISSFGWSEWVSPRKVIKWNKIPFFNIQESVQKKALANFQILLSITWISTFFQLTPWGGGLGFQQGCGHMFVCLYASPNQVIDISSLRGDIFWEYSEDIWCDVCHLMPNNV